MIHTNSLNDTVSIQRTDNTRLTISNSCLIRIKIWKDIILNRKSISL